jgi:hypothetical protein
MRHAKTQILEDKPYIQHKKINLKRLEFNYAKSTKKYVDLGKPVQRCIKLNEVVFA